MEDVLSNYENCEAVKSQIEAGAANWRRVSAVVYYEAC